MTVNLVTIIVKLVTMIVKYNYVNLAIELNDVTKQKMIEVNFIEIFLTRRAILKLK